MKLSVSILKSHYNFSKTIELLNKTNTNYIHIDVMDGLFVNNYTPFNEEMLNILKKSKKKCDVHLMTLHLKDFIDVFATIKPAYITYQFEATTHHTEIIKYIKDKGIKVGIAINPFTNLEELIPYLPKIDLVLVMSVIPGYGSQKFLNSTPERIKTLKKLIKSTSSKCLISVDGGINPESLKLMEKSKPHIAVSGSFVCMSSNFDSQIEKLKPQKKK